MNGKDTFRYPKTNCGDPDQWQFYMPHFFLLDMQLGGKWVDDVELSTLPVERRCRSITSASTRNDFAQL